MRLGAPVLDPPRDPQELAQAHVDLDCRAAFCPWGLSVDDTPYLHALRQSFEERDVILAEVIGWRNLIPRDETMRKAAFEWVCEQLAVAEELGARCCLTFGGTLDNETSWTPHSENLSPATFDLIVATVRRVLDEVQPRRTKLALEMMASVFPDSAESCLALVKAVDRRSFGVHLDPVNIILTREQYFDNASLIRECVEKLGPWIVSCHAKDIIWLPKRGFHFAECIPGTGVLDFRAYLAELKRLSPDLPLLLEHLSSQEEYRQGYDYLRSIEAELDSDRTR